MFPNVIIVLTLVPCAIQEAEFAFLVAQFGYANDLFSRNIYASVVLAVLSSTIVSPVLLRITLASYSPPLTNENEASQLVN